MEHSGSLAVWLVLWMVGGGFAVSTQWGSKSAGAGLVLAYVLDLWTIHWPGAGIYLLPWYSGYAPDLVEVGFSQSVYAIAAFAAGVGVVGPWFLRRIPQIKRGNFSERPRARDTIVYFLGIGLLFSLILLPQFAGVPSITAIFSAGSSLIVAGLGLGCWDAWRSRSHGLIGWIVAALCLPFLTIITSGFLGYGAGASVAVVALVASFYRPRWKVIVVGLVLGYLGLSFYVGYMRDRNDIREVVWGGQNLGERVEQLYRTVRASEWFDPYDSSQLEQIDDRLNQNVLVGSAVNLLTAGGVDFARGETLWDAVLAVVPRAFWPDKPVAAGSGDLASRYTGTEFSEGTSVGIGQVLEFYVNFGTLGVVLGFGAIGALLSVIDSTAGLMLAVGDWRGFSLWYLPGLALLQVGGSLVEVAASAGASFIVAVMVNRLVVGGARITGRLPASSTAVLPISSPRR